MAVVMAVQMLNYVQVKIICDTPLQQVFIKFLTKWSKSTCAMGALSSEP